MLKLTIPKKRDFILPITIISLGITVSYYINQIYGKLYDAIQNYKPTEAWQAIAIFCGLAGIAVLLDSYETYELNKLQVKMRTILIQKLHFNVDTRSETTLPQRIQEDTIKYCQTNIELGTAFFKAAVKIPLFIGVITTLTNWWTGLIVLVSVILGTLLTKWISKSLVMARSEYESAEAYLRHNFSSMLLFPLKAYILTVDTYHKYNKELKKLTLLSGGLGQIFVLLPFMLLLPLYFAGTLTLGSFFQSVKALDKIISSLSVVIDNRNTMTVNLTAKNRLIELTKQSK